MARPKRNSSEDVRGEVVGHALRLIGQHGFDAISVADIADAAGMSKQALLYHFETKDALKAAVVEHLLTHANKAMLSVVATVTQDPGENIERAIGAIHELFDAEPFAAAAVLRFILDDDRAVLKRMMDGLTPWLRYTVEELRRGERDKRFRPIPDPEATTAEIGMLVVTNFAMLSQHGWSDSTPEEWRRRRLAEMIRQIRLVLLAEPSAKKAK